MTVQPYGTRGATDVQFFRLMITVMAAVIFSGFALNLALGRSSFSAPLIVHIHGIAFMGWLAIVVTQVWLVGSGHVALHRTLGRVAVVYFLGLSILGPAVTINAAQTGRVPFFFQPQLFLMQNSILMVGVATLFAAAIAYRKQTDWHARLQVGMMLMLMGPGFGRILPSPFLTPYAYEAASLAGLIFPFAGMVRDLRVQGRIHSAWYWGIGVLIACLIVARLLGFSSIGEAYYSRVTEGTPQAAVSGLAFPPAPGAAAPEAAPAPDNTN